MGTQSGWGTEGPARLSVLQKALDRSAAKLRGTFSGPDDFF